MESLELSLKLLQKIPLELSLKLMQELMQEPPRENSLKEYKMYDYIVTNHIVEDTVNNITSILQAEKFKTQHYLPTAPDIKLILKDEVD